MAHTPRPYRSLLADLDLTGLTAKHRALLTRGIRGGDGEETLDDLLAQVEGAADLEDDALASLIESLRSQILALVPEDPRKITAEALAQAQDASEKLQALEAIATTRQTEADARALEAQALVEQLTAAGPEDEDQDDGDEDVETETETTTTTTTSSGDGEAATETETVEETTEAPVAAEEAGTVAEPETVEDPPERVAASRPAAPQVTRMRPRAPDMRPRARETAVNQHSVLRASSNIPNVTPGSVLTSEGFGEAMQEALRASAGHRGSREYVPVASIGSLNPRDLWGDERYLDYNDRENERKINALIGGSEKLAASGGFCAPVPYDYTQPILGTDERPVRGALSRFGADRSGVQLIPAPTMADAQAGVGIWTATNDTTPGSDGAATKPCVTMSCPAAVPHQVYAVTTCVKIDNFRNMYFRENVDAFQRKLAQAAARTAEARLLTRMGAASSNVTVGTVLGTTRTVLAGLDRAAAGMRYRQRLGADYPLQVILPAWLLDNMETDLAREAPGASTERLAIADSYLESFFTSRHISPTWALDGETGQTFGAQADGPLNGWPSHAIGYLYVAGQWLYLDGGMLNLGVVRDATLVGTNDAIVFAEFMEEVAFHGEESLRIDFDICPDGSTSLPIDIDPCTLNS